MTEYVSPLSTNVRIASAIYRTVNGFVNSWHAVRELRTLPKNSEIASCIFIKLFQDLKLFTGFLQNM